VEAFQEWLVAALSTEPVGSGRNRVPTDGTSAGALTRPTHPLGVEPGAAAEPPAAATSMDVGVARRAAAPKKGARTSKAGGRSSRASGETSQQRAHRLFYERKKERVGPAEHHAPSHKLFKPMHAPRTTPGVASRPPRSRAGAPVARPCAHPARSSLRAHPSDPAGDASASAPCLACMPPRALATSRQIASPQPNLDPANQTYAP
jgi:hypothetical protein